MSCSITIIHFITFIFCYVLSPVHLVNAADSDSSLDEEALFPRVGRQAVDVAVVHSQYSASESDYGSPPFLVAREVVGSYGSMEYRQTGDDEGQYNIGQESDLDSLDQPSVTQTTQEMQGLIGSDTEQSQRNEAGFFVKIFS